MDFGSFWRQALAVSLIMGGIWLLSSLMGRMTVGVSLRVSLTAMALTVAVCAVFELVSPSARNSTNSPQVESSQMAATAANLGQLETVTANVANDDQPRRSATSPSLNK